MAIYDRCEKCKSFTWLPHACKPFEVAFQEKGEPEWREIYAMDGEIAAEKFAENYDCDGDYTILKAGDGGDTIVLVRDADKPESVLLYHVYGETVPQYHARAVI